ncbi:hypothetical protein D3C81_1048030 [compost metagenome]
MPCGDLIQRLTRCDHQHLHRRQAQAPSLHVLGHQVAEVVETLKQLNIVFQAIDEGAVEHVSANLRQAWLLAAEQARARLTLDRTLRVATDADHQHAAGAQVQGRADRCRLTYRAIAKVLLTEFDRSEQQWNGGAG